MSKENSNFEALTEETAQVICNHIDDFILKECIENKVNPMDLLVSFLGRMYVLHKGAGRDKEFKKVLTFLGTSEVIEDIQDSVKIDKVTLQ